MFKDIMGKYKRTVKNCFLNTGTIFDLATGNFLPGKNGSMILNGGVYTTTAITGRPQTYKSAIAGGYFGRVLHNYKEANGLVWETEMSLQGKKRIEDISGSNEIGDRFEYYDGTEVSLEDSFEIIKEISNKRSANPKEYIVETPFIDLDGKFIKTFIPAIILIDSWSAASSSKEVSLFEDNKIGDSKTNMVAMNDGKIKSDFARQLPYLCGSKGIYLISTAHIGNQANLDPYAPNQKDLPMMRSSDKLKHVGTQYSFLSTNMIETRKVQVLQDSAKKALYPYEGCSSDVELQMISSFITRCKNNVSGDSIEHISSQFFGIQEYLEYYNIIKESKSNILEGTINQKLGIYDKEFTRKNIRELIATDPLFRRALEIAGHFVFVRNRFNLPDIKAMGYVEFCKKFNASAALKEEMLHSSGTWQFVSKEKTNYMSILDIIAKINSQK